MRTCIHFPYLLPGQRLYLWLPSHNGRNNRDNFICLPSRHNDIVIIQLTFVHQIDICSYDSSVKISLFKNIFNLKEAYQLKMWKSNLASLFDYNYNSYFNFVQSIPQTQNIWETIIYNNFAIKFFLSYKRLKNHLKTSQGSTLLGKRNNFTVLYSI